MARALPDAEPCAHPSTWEFDDDLLDTWSAAGQSLAAVRALRDPDDRIEALLRVLPRLSGDEREEVPRSDEPADALYMVARVIRTGAPRRAR